MPGLPFYAICLPGLSKLIVRRCLVTGTVASAVAVDIVDASAAVGDWSDGRIISSVANGWCKGCEGERIEGENCQAKYAYHGEDRVLA